MTNRIKLVVAAIVATSTVAFAQSGPYVEVGGNYTRAKDSTQITAQRSPNVAVGYDFGKVGPVGTSVAAELDHESMGHQFTAGDYTRATSISGIVSLPVANNLSVYGRAGVANVQQGRDANLTNVLGVGAEYKFTQNVSVTAEAKRYGPKINSFVTSVKYTF